MFYDFSLLWPWLLIVALLAIGIGWYSQNLDWRAHWRDSWLKRMAILIAVALVIAWLPIFHGRFAFWWESAVLFGIVYLLFGVIGYELRRGEIRRHLQGDATGSSS